MHRRGRSPASTNPFTGRGLPNHPGGLHGHPDRNPMLTAMAKKALLLVLSFTVFFYIVGYSGGKDDHLLLSPKAGKGSKNFNLDSGSEFKKKEPTKLVLPLGGKDESRSAGAGGTGSDSGEGRDLDSSRKVFAGYEENDRESGDRGLNLGGRNSKLNWSTDGERPAPPSQDEDNDFDGGDRNDDGTVGRSRFDNENSDYNSLGGGGLRGGVGRSEGKTQSGDSFQFGRGRDGQDGSADKSAGFASDVVNVDAYRKNAVNSDDGSKDADARVDSSFYHQQGQLAIPRGAMDASGDRANKNRPFQTNISGDVKAYLKRPDHFQNNVSGDVKAYLKKTNPKKTNPFQTNVSGDVKAYLQSINKSSNQKDVDGGSDNTKGSGDVAPQKEPSGGASFKKQYSDDNERIGNVSYQKKYTNSERHSAYKKDDEDVSKSKKSDNAFEDSNDVNVKMYPKSNRDSSHQKDPVKGYGDATYEKRNPETIERSGDGTYKKTISDANERTDDVSYQKKYANSGKRSTYKKDDEDVSKSKDSSDVKVKDYRRSNKGAADREGISDDSDKTNVMDYLESNKGAAARDDTFDDREKTKGSGSVAYKERYSDAKERSGDVAYKKKYSGLEKHSTYEKRSDESVGESKKIFDAMMDSSDAKKHSSYMENIDKGRASEKDKDASYDVKAKKYLKPKKIVDDSDKTKISSDVAYKKDSRNIAGVEESVKDSDATNASGDGADASRYSGTRKHSSYKKNIGEVGASIKESDAAKDSSDAKKYLGSGKASADQKPIESDDETKNRDDVVEEKRYYGTKKHLSSWKDIDEVGASIKKSDVEEKRYYGTKKHLSSWKDIDEVGASIKKSDASKDSSNVKMIIGSDKASTDQRDMRSGDKMKDSGDVAGEEVYSATKKHSPYNRNIGEVGAASKKVDAIKGSGNVSKVVDSEKGSSDRNPANSKNEGDGSVDENDFTDQKSIEDVRASEKKSGATKDSTKDFGGIKKKALKKASTNEKNSDEELTSLYKKIDATKNFTDVAEKDQESEEGVTDQKNSDEAEVSVKTRGVLSKLRNKKKSVDPADKESNADEDEDGDIKEKVSPKALTDEKIFDEELTSLYKKSDATKNSTNVVEKDQESEEGATDQKNSDEAEESVKKSGVLSRLRKEKKSVDPADKESNAEKDRDSEKGADSEKALTNEKNVDEQASLNKKSDATKNSTDVAEKDQEPKEGATDQKTNDEAEESVKTSGVLSRLRKKKKLKKKKSVDPADKESIADEAKGLNSIKKKE